VNKHLEHVFEKLVLKTELLPWRILIVWCKSFIKLIKKLEARVEPLSSVLLQVLFKETG
jgi:hypothetical protein